LSKSKACTVNGWTIFAHPLFLAQVQELIQEVTQLRKNNPQNYHKKNASKRLAAIAKLVFEKIPEDPALQEYRQGTTLGDDKKHWFRAKFFQQYPLFFRFHSKSKIIVYAWVNDEKTKRAYGNKSDAYAIFKKMLKNNCPPSDWKGLLNEAEAISEFL
jgi:toxin YhaV